MTDGRTERGADTKQKLLNSARALFSQHGYNGASVRMVADTAGVNPALVRYHFGSKQGLWDAACSTVEGDHDVAAARLRMHEALASDNFTAFSTVDQLIEAVLTIANG